MLLNKEWQLFLESEFEQKYFQELNKFVSYEYKTKTIYPMYENIFQAFNLLSPNKVKVIIIGQDPYHGSNQANGLAFSVENTSKIPPSLRNIYKELVNDIGCKEPKDGDLSSWAIQGVLLINTVLTVIESQANSHRGKGWENFTDAVISKMSLEYENIVFILWGSSAQNKAKIIDKSKHYIITSVHPSPLSAYRGFFGSKPFSKTNDYLRKQNIDEIQWCLTPR